MKEFIINHWPGISLVILFVFIIGISACSGRFSKQDDATIDIIIEITSRRVGQCLVRFESEHTVNEIRKICSKLETLEDYEGDIKELLVQMVSFIETSDPMIKKDFESILKFVSIDTEDVNEDIGIVIRRIKLFAGSMLNGIDMQRQISE